MHLIGKINALIYARVSTTDQANKGFSIESQIERCKERAISKFGYKESEIIALVEPGAWEMIQTGQLLITHYIY